MIKILQGRTQQVSAAFGAVVAWLAIGTFAYHELEGWNYIQSLYFSTVTLTTIGYGDLHPTSDISRLFTVFYIIFGVFTVIGAVGIIGAWRVEMRAKRREGRKEHKGRLL